MGQYLLIAPRILNLFLKRQVAALSAATCLLGFGSLLLLQNQAPRREWRRLAPPFPPWGLGLHWGRLI